MARHLALGLFALAVLAVPGAAPAADAPEASALARIVSSGTLRVGMSGGQPPLNFRSKSGEMLGLEVELARALARLMQVELEIVERPFAELLPALAANDVDIVMSGVTATPQRSLEAAFVGPYFLSGKSVLTRSSSLAQADEAGDLDRKTLKLAALAGSTSERFVRSVLPKASLVSTPDTEKAVELLLADEVDAVVADRETVLLHAYLHPKEGLVTLREPLTLEPIGIAAPAADLRLATYLGNALDALEASGVASAVRARWLDGSDWIRELP